MQYISDFILFRGEKICYWIYGELTSTSKPLLVVHGGPGSPHNYLLPLSELSKDRPVIFYDQLGCGKSVYLWKDTSHWCLEYFLQELVNLVEELKLKDFHLLGHSWGSILAAEYTLAYQSNLKSLILASPCLSIPLWVKDAKELLAKLPKKSREIIQKHQILGTVDSEECQIAAMQYYQRHVCRLAVWPQAMMDSINGANDDVYRTIWGESEFLVSGNIAGYDVTQRLAEITIPTLFTCGRYDEARPETTISYKETMPRAEIAIFENSSHLPHFEEKGKYLQVLSEFIRLNS